MPVEITLRNNKYQVDANITVKQALVELGYSPQSHLVVREGKLLTEKDILKDGDEVKLVAVISGGGN